MTPYHFTRDNYRALALAVINAKPSDRHERGDHEQIVLSNPIQGVEMSVSHWESGHWAIGGVDDYGRKERIWEATGHDYEVDCFEYFDSDDDCAPNDFDKKRFEAILNGKVADL
jgi:hypothetical protein